MYLDTAQLINLSTVPGVGPTRLRSLVARFQDVDRIFGATFEELVDIENIDRCTAQHILDFTDHDFGAAQLEKLNLIGARILTFWDDEYPELLKRIYDPPTMLFIKGDFVASDATALAIVGARNISNYGKIVTEMLTKQLCQYNITIVSGLARGVDTIAHWTALHAGARTIAVMGSGLDCIYPSENRKLAEKISEQGALISEFHCGVGPEAVNFPRRNRIIAGLSKATIVTEAGIKSGALITAHIAVESNRDVCAVPGAITSNKSDGCHKLIREGAKLVTCADDIIDEVLPHVGTVQPSMALLPPQLNTNEKQVIANLSDNPIHIDVLARQMNKSSHEILTTLLTLEVHDCIKQLPGKYFVLTKLGFAAQGE